MNPTTKPLTPRTIWYVPFLIILAWCTIGCRSANSIDPSAEVFCAEYCVSPTFQEFYNDNGGAAVFGAPISGELALPREEEYVSQYFESMRIDYYPQSGQFNIPSLGEWAFEGLSPEDQETMLLSTHDVAAPFVGFYNIYDGREIFGDPLTPLLQDGSLRVQYFEKVRLEWQPGLTTTSGLSSGSLGRAHFDQTAYNYEIIAQPIQDRLEQVNLSAVVSAPILFDGESQTFFIQVFSPSQEPVDGIDIQIMLGSSDNPITVEATTDSQGKAAVTLDPATLNLTPGNRVQATIGAYNLERNLLGETSVTFETWW